MIVWVQFALCTALILFSGARLSRYGDVLAEKTSMGATWVGVVLFASVTSLPELITGVSSVAIYQLPDIAVGDVLGSCLFNLLILAVLDFGMRRPPISSLASRGHILTGLFGILLLGLTTLIILAADLIPSLGWISIGSLLLIALYLLAMRFTFSYEQERGTEVLVDINVATKYAHISKSHAWRRFGLYAAILIAGATYLPHVADQVATSTGINRSFVGSIFIAMSTSLPEIVVTRTALQIGAVDMAIGNVLGSNLFDIAILGVDDFAYLKGPLLRDVAPIHALTAVAAISMTAIWLAALVCRPRKKLLFLSWDSMGMIFIYSVTCLLLLFKK